MAKLSNQEFYDKWVPLLADNVFQEIDGARFEQLLADLRDTFASQASVALQPVAPAVNFDPVLRQLTATHLLGASALEYNQNNGGFTAYAPIQVDDLGHAQGEWRFRVKADAGRNGSQTTDSPLITPKGTANAAGPGKIKAIDISDSTEAGRALLTAKDVAAQRKLLDNFVILAGQYGVGQPRFEHTAGEDGLYAYLLRALASLGTPAAPKAPTDGQVDDLGDVFSFQPPAGYSFAQLKIAGLPSTTGAEWLSAANSYVQNGRIYVRVMGAVPAGGLSVYVGASGNVPDGLPLTNNADFRANNVMPTVPGALAVDFTVDNANLSPGDTLGFTAKASGGTAPYEHSVQALNVDTGAVVVIATASTPTLIGAWEKVLVGVYLVTDAVKDAAGASLVSATRRVVVAAPGAGGGALVPATRTRLGGVRIGEGLTVGEDGLLSADAGKLLESDNVWTGYNVFTKQLEIKSSFGQELTVIERFDDGTLFAYNQATGQDANFEGADFGSSNAPRDFYYYSDLAEAVAEYRDLPGKRVHWVQGGLSNMYVGGGPRGTLLRPYYSLAHAHDNAAENDTIMVLPGGEMTDALGRPCYGGYTQLTKNVTVCNLPGVIYAGTVDVGQFASEKPFRTYWYGGIILGALNIMRQSTGPSYFLGQDIRLEGIGQLHAFAQGTYGTHRDTIDIRRLVGRQQQGAAQAINFSGRSDGTQVQDVFLTDFDLESVSSPFFNWGGSDGNSVTAPSQLILRGTGRMVRADGGAYLTIRPTTPFGAMLTEDQIIKDERLKASAPSTGGGGANYAVAVLSGTVLKFTQDAEYQSIQNGTFTVDTAGAVVGVVVRVRLGISASEPYLSGYNFKHLGNVKFVPGRAYLYSFCVALDNIVEYYLTPL